ncbi:hypothetical protein [Spirosoma gilvum]
MSLIHLPQIRELYQEAQLRKHLVDSYSYTPKAEMDTLLDDAMMVSIFRMHSQARNLLDQLTKLHQVCSDFASGKLQNYLTQHLADTGDKESFDPFFELDYLFNGETIYDLPSTIESYEELYAMSLNFANIRQAADRAFELAFEGKLNWHLPIQEGNQTRYVPENELPQDLVNNFRYEQQIANIQIEYCLDRYNQFYSNCLRIIQLHRTDGTIQECAREILTLISD